MVDAHLSPPEPKQLASNVKKERDAACKQLSTYLSGGRDAALPSDEAPISEEDWAAATVDSRFSDKEMLVLWKGLFYCMWMSDKPLVQQALCNSLADMLLDVRVAANGRPARVKAAAAFLRGFWATLSREWSGVDRLRTDKYYLLMRRYVTATFALLIREQWDPLAIAEINAVLIGPGGPLNVRDQKTPLSIFSHVADIYLSSLSAAIAASPSASDLPPVPLLALLQPITHALCYAPAKHIHALAQANALLPLLSACDAAAAAVSTAESAPVAKKRRTGAVDAAVARAFEPFDALLAAPLDLGEPDGAGVQSARAVKRAVLRGVFEAAARAETPDANRRRLYTVCQEQSDEPL